MLLTNFINSYKNAKILCIGDIMLDRFCYGSATRISPEAPVPVFNYHHAKEMLGGAGNVVANLSSLGCQTQFIGAVGNDADGRKVASMLKSLGVKAHLLHIKDIPTIVKTRLIAGNNHLLRVDMEEKFPNPEEILSKIEKVLEIPIRNSDLILLSDYNKGTLPKCIAQLIIKLAHKNNKKVLVDPKGNDYSKYASADLVKPNLKEFIEATGISTNPKLENFKEDLKAGAEKLNKKFGIENLIVTLSEYGMAFIPCDCSEEIKIIPTKAKEVFDVSGAGDTVLATLGASLSVGANIKEAMKLANTASGIVVGKLGTACVNAEELKEALSDRPATKWPVKNKIVSVEQAKEITEQLKQNGKKIGFTNGCFDLLHAGHLQSFINAKKECDVLVVGINSDSSVKRLKGETRPVQDEKTRALLLASLEFVDYVIVFNDDTALPIIEKIKPEVICKEGYTIDKWPEAQFVIAYGGRAITLPRLEGYSTTETIKRISN